MKKVVDFSKHQKKCADKILSDTDLVNILSGLGRVNIIGSYAYDLMIGPDIDIEVVTETPRKTSVTALKKLVEMRAF